MESLKNKIDFAAVVSVTRANPNGDPLNGNRPRVNYDGTGELSDVCLKRKIRNRLLEAGYAIFVQSDDNRVDNYRSLAERAKGELGAAMMEENKLREAACKKWIDVRSFGQLFAFKNEAKKKNKKAEGQEETEDKGVSIGIRGPVSIHSALSVAPVNVTSMQITKSVSSEGDGSKRGSDTMGMKHRVDHGLYVFYGSMNPQLATRTGFTHEDAEGIKQALLHLFENDASSARPEGSMEVVKLFWWEHNCPSGQYSSAKVHRTLTVTPKNGEPKSALDYDVVVGELPGLKPESLDGF
jgi:CRISPR-associated protein Csd2